MKTGLATVLMLWTLQVLPAVAQTAPVEPQRPVSEPTTAQAKFKAAEVLLANGQSAQAIAALREGLVMAPAEVDARLRLVGLLMAQHQPAEAARELRTVLAVRPDAKTYAMLLNALQTAGSPIDLAMTAEEALARYPGQIILTWAAVEALVAVGAPERALKHWQTLHQPEQTSAHGQWLRGVIHEASHQPAKAYAAYQLAAGAEPKAKVALARLSASSLALGGQRYFAPTGWSILPGTPALLIDAQSGARATLMLWPGTQPQEALLQTLAKHLPVPPATLAELLMPAMGKPAALIKASPPPDNSPPELLQIVRMDCPGLLCVQAAPNQEFIGLLPTLQAGVLDLNPGAWVIVLEGTDRVSAPAALNALFAVGLVTEEGKL